jgi:hypothetical protein
MLQDQTYPTLQPWNRESCERQLHGAWMLGWEALPGSWCGGQGLTGTLREGKAGPSEHRETQVSRPEALGSTQQPRTAWMHLVVEVVEEGP